MTSDSGPDSDPRTLAPGEGIGEVLVLDEPLSLWGGIDPSTGQIIDRRHPQLGASITRRILVMPSGRGSSSSSTILAEAIRAGTAPAGILLRDPDPILAVGSVVAAELYERRVPVVVVPHHVYQGFHDGQVVRIEASGTDRPPRLLYPS